MRGADRRDGYSIVDEELAFGLRAVAVPLRNQAGEVVCLRHFAQPGNLRSAREGAAGASISRTGNPYALGRLVQ
ncbi:MAG: hypothetical protein I8H77_16685 [Comamonadaceae bacterium]|nr:hypothetical protein [Comamonadaceae bacterium]